MPIITTLAGFILYPYYLQLLLNALSCVPKARKCCRLDLFYPRVDTKLLVTMNARYISEPNFQARIPFNRLLFRNAANLVATSGYPLRNIKATNKQNQTTNYKTTAIRTVLNASINNWILIDDIWLLSKREAMHISSENRHEFQSSLISATSFFNVGYLTFNLSHSDVIFYRGL